MLRQLFRGRALPTTISLQSRQVAASASASASAHPNLHVIFGATGGIGSTLAHTLSAQGDRVVIIGRDTAKVDTLAASVQPLAALTLDPLKGPEVDAALKQLATDHGPISGVVNCIGNLVLKGAHSTTDAEWDNVIQTNLYTAFNIVRGATKVMTKAGTGGGSIVLLSSAVASHGLSNHEAIAAAKGGVEGLMLSSAATYAPKNIRVNCVAPGLTRTPLAKRITDNEAALAASTNMHALKRIGEVRLSRGREISRSGGCRERAHVPYQS
jgi:3-oxoacyl-[acyl-carrier protein] reductase